MPTVARDMSIGEAGDVSIGDLHKNGAYRRLWKTPTFAESNKVGRTIDGGRRADNIFVQKLLRVRTLEDRVPELMDE